MSDDIRYAFASAGIPVTEEQIAAIYATGHPIAVTDVLLSYAERIIGPVCEEMLAIIERCVEEARKPDERWPLYEYLYSSRKAGRYTVGTRHSVPQSNQ